MDGDNVIRLVPSKKSEPNGEIIAQLELLLELARNGSIQSFGYVAVGDPTGAPAVGWSGPDRNALTAGSLMLVDTQRWRRDA